MNINANCSRGNFGFSLIELMIVVAIIAIIAAIAYPSYERSVMRSDRSDATAALTQDAQVFERCYTQYFAYDNPTCATTTASLAGPTQNGFYTISFPTPATTSTYVIQATAVAGKRQDSDTDCQRFTLDNTGAKVSYAGGGSTTSTECWGG
ncbi:MAG: type IV pilin protein [Gammaproteobacteria bacterium]